MPIKPSSAKAKGRRLQQLVRDKILALFPALTDQDVRSTGMGQSGEDIQMASQARRLFPYSVECKAQKNIAIYKFVDQCDANCPANAEPLIVIKADRRKPLAVLDLDHFFTLIARNKSNE